MQTYQAISPALMMKFAKRQPDAPRCSSCGQWFQLSFSGGRLVEQRCGCGLVYGIGPTGQFMDQSDAKPAVALDVAEVDG
jgi:hypothetical protein